MRDYWDSVAKSLPNPPKCSTFGLIVAPYWKLERRLAAELSLSYLLPASGSKRLLLLKSDLWNEGVDNTGGDIFDFLGGGRRTAEIVGVDVSPVICHSAKRRMGKEELRVACADVRKLPFASEIFDIILDVSTLDHIPPAHIASVVNEYERVLKESGILCLIFDSVTSGWLQYLRRIFNRFRYHQTKRFKFGWRLSPDWIKGRLGESGFTILSEFRLGILSLSPIFLKAAQSNLTGKAVPRLLYSPIRSAKLAKALRSFPPLSTQYLFVARKQGAYGRVWSALAA